MEVRAEADETRLADAIDELAPHADIVLIDTAGFGNRAALLAIAPQMRFSFLAPRAGLISNRLRKHCNSLKELLERLGGQFQHE